MALEYGAAGESRWLDSAILACEVGGLLVKVIGWDLPRTCFRPLARAALAECIGLAVRVVPRSLLSVPASDNVSSKLNCPPTADYHGN
jgi:hypothetical protein